MHVSSKFHKSNLYHLNLHITTKLGAPKNCSTVRDNSSDADFVVSPQIDDADVSDPSEESDSQPDKDTRAPDSAVPPKETARTKPRPTRARANAVGKQTQDSETDEPVQYSSANGNARRKRGTIAAAGGRGNKRNGYDKPNHEAGASRTSDTADTAGEVDNEAGLVVQRSKVSRPTTPKGRADKDNWALILKAKDRVRKLVVEKEVEAAQHEVKASQQNNADVDPPELVQEVLKELGDEETTRLYSIKIDLGKEKYERDQKLFTVIATGARPGELLRGIRDKTRNAVVRVNTLIRPSARRLLTIHHSRRAWALFLKKLGQVAFFHPLSLEDRSDWLVEHAITEDYDLADVPGLILDFSSLGSGSSAFLTRSEQQMELMLTKSEDGEGISPTEVLGMFQNKPGSKGLRGRPTLVFLRQYWKVESTHIEVDSFPGVCISVASGKVLQGAQILDAKSEAAGTDEMVDGEPKQEESAVKNSNPEHTKQSAKSNTGGGGGSTILLFSGFERGDTATTQTTSKRLKVEDTQQHVVSETKKTKSTKKSGKRDAEVRDGELAAGSGSDEINPDTTAQQTVGFIVSKRNLPLSQSEALAVAQVSEKEYLKIKPSLRGFTAAGYKSLLQKIIRARPRQIELLDGQRIDAGIVLRTAVVLLFLHAGAFVPDIQRYVTGAESALKRVAVSVLEESYTSDHQSLLSLLAAAWVAQASARLWRPGMKQLRQAVKVAMHAWRSEDKFKWSRSAEGEGSKRKDKRILKEYVLSSSNTALENCSAMLDRLRSFQGDLLMTREIAHNEGGKRVFTGASGGPKPQSLECLSILHAVDHHWCPDFVYFFPPDITTQLKNGFEADSKKGNGTKVSSDIESGSATATPFQDIFTEVFKQSAGVNTRVAFFDPETPFNVHVRKAQKLALQALSKGVQVQRPVEKTVLEQKYQLDRAWIAGLVGAIEVMLTKPSTAALVTLRPDDPRQLVAFRRPSRDSTRKAGGSESGLTDAQEEQAKALARDILSAGVKLDKSAAPMAQLKGALLYYQTVDQIPHLERRPTEAIESAASDSSSDFSQVEDTDAGEDATCIYNTLTGELMDASVPESEFARYVIKSADGSAAFEGDWEELRKCISHTFPVHPTPVQKGSKTEPKSLESILDETAESTLITGSKPSSKAKSKLQDADTAMQQEIGISADNDRHHQDIDRVLLGLTTTGAGIEAEAKRKTSHLLRETCTRYIIRAFSIASAFSATFAFPRISRDGGGTEQQPSPDDIGAFQFMLRLSTLYPGVFRWSGAQIPSFTVVVGPGFWKLRRECLAELASISETDTRGGESTETYPSFSDSRNSPRGYQKDAVNEMIAQHRSGRRGNFLYLPVGLGKTKIVMDYASWLQSEGQLPRTILWTLPASALESVRQEMRFYNLPVRILWPLKRPFPVAVGAKSSKSKIASLRTPANASSDYYRGDKLLDGAVNFIQHDHLRLCHESLLRSSVANDLFFIVDEVHKALNASQRTASALEIARRAKEFVALTGTPIIDNNTYKLMWWLEHIVPFEVNTRNFWAAAGAMVSKRIALGILTETRLIEGTFSTAEAKAYHETVSPALGGMNASFTEKHFRHAMQLCYAAVSRDMIRETKRLVHLEKEKVMLVAKDATHQARLVAMLTANGNGPKGAEKALMSARVFCITATASVNYTPLTKSKHNYDVVVTTMRHVEGYSLTAMRHMVTSVYPSNNAAREQLEGRMVRLGQAAECVYFHVVCIGLLHNIRRSHEEARSLSDVLKSLATVVEAPPPSTTG